MAMIEGACATHTTLECHDVAESLAFYRDVMGLEVNHVHPLVGHVWASNRHYAAVLHGAACAPQPLLNYYARPVPRPGDVDAIHAKIEAVRALYGIRAITPPAREDKAKFGVGTYGPATRQHGSYAFYFQDADTNCWELEVWDDGISPVERGLTGRLGKERA
jgi:catechol 2,3-dioxygenase-like lactoylglutathione lyase family enzyme